MFRKKKHYIQKDFQHLQTLPAFDFEESRQSTPEGDQEIDFELQTILQESPVSPKINLNDNDSTPFIEPSVAEQRNVLPAKRFDRPPEAWLPQLEIGSLHLSGWQLIQINLILGAIIAPVAVVGLIAFPLIQTGGNLPYYDCTYGGSFTFKGIDIPFGQMTFAQAKAIDLVWNTILGRTLQTLIAIFAYNVTMKALMRIAECNPISYEIYAALALSTTKLSTILPLTKSIFSTLQWRAKCAMIWLLVTTIYLAIFPTLIDATSGYQASQLTKLKLHNGSTIDLTQSISLYVDSDYNMIDFWDGRLGVVAITTWITDVLLRERPALNNSTGMQWLVPLETQPYFTAGTFGLSMDPNNGFLQGDLALSFAEPNITYTIYSYCSSLSTSKLLAWEMPIYNTTTTQIIPAAINQEYSDASCGDWYTMFLWQNDSAADGELRPHGLGHWFLNKSFMDDHNNYECVSSDFYQWGFSYAWLLITCSLNAFWLFGTCVVWLDAECNSELVKKGRTYGTWRAVLDLAEAANLDLGEHICAYSEEEIEMALEEKGPVGYVAEDRDGIGHVGLRGGRSAEANGKFRLDWRTVYGRKLE